MRTLCCSFRRVSKHFRKFKKRILSLIIMGSMISCLLSISIFADSATLSDNAIPIDGNEFFFWYLVSTSGHTANELEYYTRQQNASNSLQHPALSTTNYVWVYPFTNIVDKTGKNIGIDQDYTYQIKLEMQTGNMSGWNTMANFAPRLLVSANDPLSESMLLTDYVNDDSIVTTVTEMGGYISIDITFHVTENIPGANYIAPYIYFTGGTSMYIKFMSCTGYVDPDYSAWEMLINGALTDIQNILNQNGIQNHEDLLAIKNELGDNGEGDSYNQDVENAVGNLGNAEDAINTSLEGHTFTLGGTTILVDDMVFSRLDNYFNNLSSAEGYDTNTGILINRTFDVFVDYLGVVILISLTLGTAVTFLSHREVWRR